MYLDTFIISIICRIDEAVPRVQNGQRLRQRGPCPRLTDSEVLTMEVVGEYLGLEQDSALFASFRRHFAHFFPALRRAGTRHPSSSTPLADFVQTFIGVCSSH
jgi:hypothetical protein